MSDMKIWPRGKQAADEIASLRQRVKELERTNASHAEANSIIRRDNDTLKAELAALKAGQGEPVAIVDSDYINKIGWLKMDDEIGCGTKLYTSAPTIPEWCQNIPYEAISRVLAEVMDIAVSNGANSVSMPDEYVEIAAWLSAAPKPEEKS